MRSVWRVSEGLSDAREFLWQESPMDLLSRITFNPEQCGGRPCIRGYRLRVSDVLDMLATGMSEAQILEEYEFLEPDDLRASLAYAARQLDHPVLIPAE